MVPIRYLAQLVLVKCLLLPKRILLVSLQQLMNTTIEFVGPHLLKA